MGTMNNNIKFLASLFGVTVLVGCYILFFAPMVYKGIVIVETIEEENACRVVMGRSPLEINDSLTQEMWEERSKRVYLYAKIPRGQDFPYGEWHRYHIYIGSLNLAVAVIALGALGWEVKHQGREE